MPPLSSSDLPIIVTQTGGQTAVKSSEFVEKVSIDDSVRGLDDQNEINWTEFVKKVKRLTRMAFFTMGGTDFFFECDEVEQEVHLRVLREVSVYETSPDDLVSRRVYVVCRNCFHELRRQRVRWQPKGAVDVYEQNPPAQGDDDQRFWDQHEGQRAFELAKQVLPDNVSEALVLRYRDGVSVRDIAVRLGVPENTLSQRLGRALRQLRDHLEAAEGAGGSG